MKKCSLFNVHLILVCMKRRTERSVKLSYLLPSKIKTLSPTEIHKNTKNILFSAHFQISSAEYAAYLFNNMHVR